jgi:hypothetical protein
VLELLDGRLRPESHPEERRLRRVSKNEPRGASWFETAQVRLLTMSSTQSNPETVRRHAGLDCFVACALRNDESNFARTAALPWTRLRPGIRIKPNGPAFAPAVKSRSPSPAIG